MYSLFYIVRKESSGTDWYSLRVKDVHFTMSCGSSLDRILRSLKSYVKRYKTRDRMLKVVYYLEQASGGTGESMLAHYEEEFRTRSEEFEDLVYSTVREAVQELVQEEKENSPFRKTQRRLNKVKTSFVKPTLVVEKEKPVKKLLSKPKVYKMH